MYSATEIARYVINYSNQINAPVSNLKLQKLLYYIQAAMLVERGEKCFKEPITAWAFGPVVIPVYQIYKEYGRNNIPFQKEVPKAVFDPDKMKIVFKQPQKIADSHQQIINKVIESYQKVEDPFLLVKKTHQELPWESTDINDEINCNVIESYYKANPEKIYN